MPDAAEALPCIECGYDLRHAKARCPECGWHIDPLALRQANIPWQHRGDGGRLRAFFRTFRLATFRYTRLAREAARPVDYRAARRFQAVCVVLCWLPLAGMTGYYVFHEAGDAAAWVVWGLTLIGLLAWLFAATGLASYFFHPRRSGQAVGDHAIALSYYAAAPVAAAGVTLPGGFMAASMASRILNYDWAAGIGIATCVFVAAMFGHSVLVAGAFLRVGVNASWSRVAAMAATQVVGGAALFALLVVGLPLLIVYGYTIWLSLR